MAKKLLDITVIRHGQVEGNITRRFVGITNQPLTKEGREAIANNEYEDVRLLFVSPLLRCRETASIIYPKKEQIVIENLREMDFGIFENKCHAELLDNEYYKTWMETGGRSDVPEGEGLDEFTKRVVKGFEELVAISYDYCEKMGEDELKIAAISHGGTMMTLQSKLGICGFYDKIYENGECLRIRVMVDDLGYKVIK